MDNNRLRNITVALIVIHLLVSLVHGYAHAGAQVTLSTFGQIFVLVVTFLAPLVGAALLYSRSQKFGALLVALSMDASLLFGVVFHFVLPGNDNVAEVHGVWHMLFLWTAAILAVLELTASAVAMWLYIQISRHLS